MYSVTFLHRHSNSVTDFAVDLVYLLLLTELFFLLHIMQCKDVIKTCSVGAGIDYIAGSSSCHSRKRLK